MMMMKATSWLSLLTALTATASPFAASQEDNDCVEERDFVTMNRWLNQGAIFERFDPSRVYDFDIHNGFKMTVTGFDQLSDTGLGFRCFDRCSLGPDRRNQARAVVSELEPGETYRFRIWDFGRPQEPFGGRWTNEVAVNGDTYTLQSGEYVAAYGYTTASDEGEIELLFNDLDDSFTMGFTQINLAKICGCGNDRDCPGGEICAGSDDELAMGDGVCTVGVADAVCSELDARQGGETCRFNSGSGVFAGEAFCTAFAGNPDFDPEEMCCDCSGGLTWIKTGYFDDNGGFHWREFPKINTDANSGEEVFDLGRKDFPRGIVLDPAPGNNTPRTVTVSGSKNADGPWRQVAEVGMDTFERSWADFEINNVRYLRLSWTETFNNNNRSKLGKTWVKFADVLRDVSEPEGGWTGRFSLVDDSAVERNPRCEITGDGCVTSPNWPGPYTQGEQCEITIDADTVLVATDFELASIDGDELDDYLIVDSAVRGSSGFHAFSHGPYHVPVKAGDRMLFSVNGYESATGFRICGYTPADDENAALPTWPPGVETCPTVTDRRTCRRSGCEWKRGECRARNTCSTNSSRDECERSAFADRCTWSTQEQACKATVYGF